MLSDEADCGKKQQQRESDLVDQKKDPDAGKKGFGPLGGAMNGLVKPVQPESIGNINRSASSSSSSSLSSSSAMSKQSSSMPAAAAASPLCATSADEELSNEDDEVKVYDDEGAVEEEKRCSNTLIEDKIDLCKNAASADEKPAAAAPLAFGINHLMSSPYQSPFNVAGLAAAAAAVQLHQRQSQLYNSAFCSSELLAHTFANWWPAQMAAVAQASQQQNPFSPFAAFSRFNPFMPPSPASVGMHQAAAAAAAAAGHSQAPSSSSASSSSSSSHGHMGAASSPFSLSSNRSTSSTSSTSSHKFGHESSGHRSNHNGHNHHHNQQFGGQQQQPKKRPRMDEAAGGHHRPGKLEPGLLDMHRHHAGGAFMGGGHADAMHKHMQQMMQQQQHHHHHQHQQHHQSVAAAPIQPPKPKKPHIKKPLNAFMLFMKEQRAQVVSECTLRESAAINQILGRKWHELDKSEQAKYYEMARQERLNHIKLHPDWSARDNYGIKKKGKRKREKIVGDNSDLPRKCRARFGVHQINLWCKPCRRKKKCIRFSCGDDGRPDGQMMPGDGSGGQMMYGSNGSAGEGSSGGPNSLNGANSDEDFDDDSDDDEDDDSDADSDDLDAGDDVDEDEDRTHTEEDLENKSQVLKTPTNAAQRSLNTSNRTGPKSLQNSNKVNHGQQPHHNGHHHHHLHQPVKQEFDLNGLAGMNMQNMMASFGAAANGMLPGLLPGGFYNDLNSQLSHHLQQQAAFNFHAQ